MADTTNAQVIQKSDPEPASIANANDKAEAKFGRQLPKKKPLIKNNQNKRFDSGDYFRNKSLGDKPNPPEN